MHYTKQFGIAAPEFGWVPGPIYILRRLAILEIMKKYPPGCVLEIGCGVGALLHELARHGFYGVGAEPSELSRYVASKILSKTPQIVITNHLSDIPKGHYDYVMAFEVLEHIEDDQAALNEWSMYLKPNGKLILTVPAHKRRWSDADLHAGHYRRYERSDIETKIKETGYCSVSIKTHGWPLSALLWWIKSWVRSRQLKQKIIIGGKQALDKGVRTTGSGLVTPVEVELYKLYGSPLGRIVFSIFNLQRYFYETDWGISYLILAQKMS